MAGSSGIGVYLRNVVRGLIDRHSDEFRLTLIGQRPEVGAELRLCKARIYSLREQIDVPRAIPSSTAVFWAPNYNAPFVSRGRLVVTIHDACHLALPELYSGVKRLYARRMFANVRRRAAEVIVVSEFTASEVERLAGISRDRMTVIYSGAGQSSTARDAASAKDPPYLLYVGNVKPHKNLARLIEAFEQLAPQIPHSLVIVGKREGFITPDLSVLTAADRLEGRVRFTGEVSEDSLAGYYAGASLLVHPSLYEGFGFPPLEAMSAGVPVAASNAGSIPEICGSAVQYFDPRSVESIAATIAQVLGDESLRCRLIEAGRTQVTHYSWTRAVRQVAEVLRQAAGFQPPF